MMIRKCLFPVAGYGTRFLPATKAIPKEMLPIVNKPLIQYGVEEALDAGMSKITFITGRGKRAIEDHFDVNYELENEIRGTQAELALDGLRKLMSECRFSYTRQIRMAGLGHAVLAGESIIGNEPFGVILPDDLCIEKGGRSTIGDMKRIYENSGCSVIAVEKVPRKSVSRYGIVTLEKRDAEKEYNAFKVKDLVEKPSIAEAPSDLAVIGRYILTPDIFDLLRNTKPGKNGEIQLTDALRSLANDEKLLAYKILGKRFDCGTIEGFVDATICCHDLR